MITTALLRNAFEYFAKFPMHDGVLKSFTISESASFGAEYTAFKDSITNMEEKSLIPGIPDYVFGVDEESVKKRIKEITGTFLFVDYGATTIERDKYRTNSESFLLAITVATPLPAGRYDNVETLFIGDQALDYIRQILERMEEDSRNSPFLQHVTFPTEISPFYARELFNSVGFTMMFSRKGVGLLE